jgi:hypothetical protein
MPNGFSLLPSYRVEVRMPNPNGRGMVVCGHNPIEDVNEVDFNGTVERVKIGIAPVSYTGKIATLHTHTFNKNYVKKAHAKLRGVGSYDVEKKEMVSLLWIFEGASRNVQPPARDDNPLAAVVEWRRDAKLKAASR